MGSIIDAVAGNPDITVTTHEEEPAVKQVSSEETSSSPLNTPQAEATTQPGSSNTEDKPQPSGGNSKHAASGEYSLDGECRKPRIYNPRVYVPKPMCDLDGSAWWW